MFFHYLCDPTFLAFLSPLFCAHALALQFRANWMLKSAGSLLPYFIISIFDYNKLELWVWQASLKWKKMIHEAILLYTSPSLCRSVSAVSGALIKLQPIISTALT